MTYDAIIVGARCAGSATALHLARRGYRVLVTDRATFPSDTISTHLLHPSAVASLARWGLLERLVATGCPAIHTYAYDFGSVTMAGAPGTPESPVAYCSRRTILDKLLVDAAAEAGAEVREAFKVDQILMDQGGVTGVRGRAAGASIPVIERAPMVIGADGRHSLVAQAVRPEQYHEKPMMLALYYTYWSGLPIDGVFQTYMRGNRGLGVAATHDGLTLTVGGWPYAEFEANRQDLERHFLAIFERVPELAERMRDATREAPIAGATVPNYFRKPYGPGWALVGDAGYIRDAITAQGIADAFRDAERCAIALDEALSGARPFDEAMRDYQHDRDRQALPMYELTSHVAALEPAPDMLRMLAAMRGHQACMDAFAQMNAGTITPDAFTAIVGAALASR